jgi:hypothetical protein
MIELLDRRDLIQRAMFSATGMLPLSSRRPSPRPRRPKPRIFDLGRSCSLPHRVEVDELYAGIDLTRHVNIPPIIISGGERDQIYSVDSGVQRFTRCIDVDGSDVTRAVYMDDRRLTRVMDWAERQQVIVTNPWNGTRPGMPAPDIRITGMAWSLRASMAGTCRS